MPFSFWPGLNDSQTKIINFPNSHIENITNKIEIAKRNTMPSMRIKGYSNMPRPASVTASIKKIKPTRNAFMIGILYPFRPIFQIKIVFADLKFRGIINEYITYATTGSVSYKYEFPPSLYWVIHGRLATAGQPKLSTMNFYYGEG